MLFMNFTWKAAKRASNLKKHGFDFADAEQVFHGPTITEEDARKLRRLAAFQFHRLSGHDHRDDLPYGNSRRNSPHLHAKG
jgi:uncharacterized DUF497 family protein